MNPYCGCSDSRAGCESFRARGGGRGGRTLRCGLRYNPRSDRMWRAARNAFLSSVDMPVPGRSMAAGVKDTDVCTTVAVEQGDGALKGALSTVVSRKQRRDVVVNEGGWNDRCRIAQDFCYVGSLFSLLEGCTAKVTGYISKDLPKTFKDGPGSGHT